MSHPKEYLSAVFTLLDRATQVETKGMAYPITRIELLSMPSEENPLGLPRRVFVVNGFHWKEEQT